MAKLFTVWFLTIDDSIAEAGGILEYLLVLVFAAVPWIEIAVVIPIAIGLGLHPFSVGIVAFIGNFGSVVIVIRFYQRIASWRSGGNELSGDTSKRRYRLARRLWDTYGLPGLSLASPILTGVHIAALLALVAGSRARSVTTWMAISIALWSAILVLGSIAGVSYLGLS